MRAIKLVYLISAVAAYAFLMLSVENLVKDPAVDISNSDNELPGNNPYSAVFTEGDKTEKSFDYQEFTPVSMEQSNIPTRTGSHPVNETEGWKDHKGHHRKDKAVLTVTGHFKDDIPEQKMSVETNKSYTLP